MTRSHLIPNFGESVRQSLSLAQLPVIVDVLGLGVRLWLWGAEAGWYNFLLKPWRQVGCPALA